MSWYNNPGQVRGLVERIEIDAPNTAKALQKLVGFHPETPLLRNLCVDLRIYLCDVLEYVSA